MKGLLLFSIFLLLNFGADLGAVVKTSSTSLLFDVNSNGSAEMTLNQSGLGIGTTPSSNCEVNGTTLISASLHIGGTTAPSSNCQISGTTGYSLVTVSSNSEIGSNSVTLIDSSSGNLSLTLIDPISALGRKLLIKKITASNNISISSPRPIDGNYRLVLEGLASVQIIAHATGWSLLSSYDDYTLTSELFLGVAGLDAENTLLFGTTSTSATWGPSVFTKSGVAVDWDVFDNQGTLITTYAGNNLVSIDLSATGAGTKIIRCRSSDGWTGVTAARFGSLNINAINRGIGYCTSLTSVAWTFQYNNLTTIPAGVFDGLASVTNFLECFRNNSLSSLPYGLFDHTGSAQNFTLCFFNNNLTSLPDNLFDHVPNTTSFQSTFESNGITSVPTGLFDHTPLVTTFKQCFTGCQLTTLPNGLFDHTPLVTSFHKTFLNNQLHTLPNGLFNATPLVSDFSWTFFGCNLTSLPDGLFNYTVNATAFRETFIGNELTTLDPNLFANTPLVTNFSYTFKNVSTITSALPTLWISHPGATSTQCFTGVTSATNYGDVPVAWK